MADMGGPAGQKPWWRQMLRLAAQNQQQEFTGSGDAAKYKQAKKNAKAAKNAAENAAGSAARWTSSKLIQLLLPVILIFAAISIILSLLRGK